MSKREATEIRRFPMELRTQTGRKMVGRLVTYRREYDLGRFTEEYAPGCFRKSITEAAKYQPLFMEHGHEKIPVGKAVSWQDEEDALYGTWEFDTRAEAVEAARLAENHYMSGLSVGYRPIQTSWQGRNDGRHHAVRREAAIMETSLCAMPALDDAGVIAIRSLGRPADIKTPNLDAAKAWLDQVKASTLRNG